MSDVPSFSSSWTAEILRQPPLIVPTRSFVYPQNIPGEEDALARGALHAQIRPATGGSYLISCALGFTDPNLPTGIHPCPNPDHLLALAGGYAYLSDTLHPESCTLLPLKPVTAVRPLPEQKLVIFIGFHSLIGWGAQGLLWQTARLTWEGLKITEATSTHLHGLAWNLMTDREVPFTVDLASGGHTGSAFPPSGAASS